MAWSARRFLERRAEASRGAAAFPAGDASSPRASVPGGAGRFSPGTGGGRFGAASSPGDDSASPGRTTRLDYYPDDIVPTPRQGEDASSDEGVHPNDDPSSPTWHAAPHRSPLAFSFRGGQSSFREAHAFGDGTSFAETSSTKTERTETPKPSATGRRPAIPRAGGMVVAPGPHADVLPRRKANVCAFFDAGSDAPPRALRHPADDVDPASSALLRAKLLRRTNPERTRKRNKTPRAGSNPRGFARATPTTTRVSSWASPTRERRALEHPNGARGAPDRGTFSQKMRDAETVEEISGVVAGARARLAAITGDVFEAVPRPNASSSRASRTLALFDARTMPTPNPNRLEFVTENATEKQKTRSTEELARLLRATRDAKAKAKAKPGGAERRVAFFRHAGAPRVSTRNQTGWLTGQGRPAVSRLESSGTLPYRKSEALPSGRLESSARERPAAASADWVVARATAVALGSETRAALLTAARDARARANGGPGLMASEAESLYADVLSQSLEKQLGLEEKKANISTTNPRLGMLAATDPGRFQIVAATEGRG